LDLNFYHIIIEPSNSITESESSSIEDKQDLDFELKSKGNVAKQQQQQQKKKDVSKKKGSPQVLKTQDEGDESLFDVVYHSKQSMETIVVEWFEKYEATPVDAMVELINFLIHVRGEFFLF